MSTASLLEFEKSERLAKRFASLATGYFDKPDDAKTTAAKIPLENLFRMLEMFRYSAFSDEPRSGILELGGLSEKILPVITEENWHSKIEGALSEALTMAFGNAPRDQAVREIQATLTWLATGEGALSADTQARTKAFLERFLTSLD